MQESVSMFKVQHPALPPPLPRTDLQGGPPFEGGATVGRGAGMVRQGAAVTLVAVVPGDLDTAPAPVAVAVGTSVLRHGNAR